MVIFTKKENDPVDIMQKLSRLIHQQEERIARLIEMEASDPKLSLQIDRAMRVLDTLLQNYRNMACDLGLLPRSPKVVPTLYTYPTPAQAKFQDQMMRGMQEQERAKAAQTQAAQEEAEAGRRALQREQRAVEWERSFFLNVSDTLTGEEIDAAYKASQEKFYEEEAKKLFH